jgi:hypothetical protein
MSDHWVGGNIPGAAVSEAGGWSRLEFVSDATGRRWLMVRRCFLTLRTGRVAQGWDAAEVTHDRALLRSVRPV